VKLSFWPSCDIRFVVPTPWAAYAFHPLDGYAQSLPYHCFVYLFPMHRFVFLSLFLIINLWTILVCHFFHFPFQSIQLLPDPRFRYDHWSLAGKRNQRSCSPHFASPVFHC
jgi:sterol desaturase/sphingolipid hydroxylase (fatty acid hydroxylase superfamily)